MKKFKNTDKVLSRDEMKSIFAGTTGGPLEPNEPYDPLGAGKALCMASCDGLSGYRCIYYNNRWICSHP